MGRVQQTSFLAHLQIRPVASPYLDPTLTTMLPATCSAECLKGQHVSWTWHPCPSAPLLLCYSPRRPHARLSKWRSTPAPSSSISTPGSLSPSPYGHSRAGPPWPAAMPHGWAWPSHHEPSRAELSGLMDARKSSGAPPPLPHRRRGHHWPESAKPTVLLCSYSREGPWFEIWESSGFPVQDLFSFSFVFADFWVKFGNL